MHTIDAKGRVSIPAGFRTQLMSGTDEAPILTNADSHLELFPFDDWCAYEKEILSVSAFDPDARSFARMVVSGATPCPIDGQGRILVPPPLREFAALEREVTIAGVGPRIELWDKTRFDAELNRTQARFFEISKEISRREA